MATTNRHEEPSTPPRHLSSWKEIAAVLGISVRTAQIYEKSRGLPVQRDGKRVAALESDLLEWRSRRLAEIHWWTNVVILQRIAAALALGILSLAGMLLWTTRSAWQTQRVAYATWHGNTITAYSAEGSPVWHRVFPYPINEDVDLRTPRVAWVGDLDHDGEPETLSIYPHVQRESKGWELYCFSSTGANRWKLSISQAVQNSTREFSPPYVVRSFVTFPSPEHDSTLWTAAVFVHHTLSPSVLLVVDSSGRQRGEYWQFGHMNVVRALDLDGDGIDEILAGGIRESDHQAVLLVFDPRNVHGSPPPESPASQVQLRGMFPGTEKAVVYFPRTILNRKREPFNFIETIDLIGDSIQVTVHETLEGQKGYLLYTLDRQLQAVDVAPSAAFNSAVMRLHAEQDLARDLGPEGINTLRKQLRIDRR
ncbi:helix-turn-helix domain-containing protein [Paludibaculum fermentans]|uniref:helix-turn-helix domain-containing protein n=1 Tax=Paludibaculum fermentans TaxID=1473598 RepID=UPI003EBCC4A1